MNNKPENPRKVAVFRWYHTYIEEKYQNWLEKTKPSEVFQVKVEKSFDSNFIITIIYTE